MKKFLYDESILIVDKFNLSLFKVHVFYKCKAESAKLFGGSLLKDKDNASGGKIVNKIRTQNSKELGLIFEIESSKDIKAY